MDPSRDPAVEPTATDPSEVLEPGPSPMRRPLDQSLDDTDAGWGVRADRSARDRWLEEQRPPHWE